MKALFLLPLLFLFCATSHARTNDPKRLLGSFVYKGIAYTYEFTCTAEDIYSLRITTAHQSLQQQPVEIDFTSLSTLESAPNTSNSEPDYIFAQFDEDVFRNVFQNQMIHKHGQIPGNELEDLSARIFYQVKGRFAFLDDEPVTAHLILRKDYVHSLLKSNSSAYYTGALSWFIAGHRVESVRVETEDGAIKNIIAHFVAPSTDIENVSPRNYVEFKNAFPISISAKFDPEYFSKIRLYCLNCYGITGLDRFLKLSDLLELDIQLDNDKEDYSPVNSTHTLLPSHTVVELKKEKRSRILEVAAFTDFVGLDQEQPNGLIQIEAKRRINIITKSRQVKNFDLVDDISNQLNLSGISELSRKKEPRRWIHYKVIKQKKPSDVLVTFTGKRDSKPKEGDIIGIRTVQPKPDNKKIEVKKISKNIYMKDTTICFLTRHGDRDSLVLLYDIWMKNKPFRSSYWSAVSSIEPRLLFSKLEQNNRFIDSLGLDGNKIDPVKMIQYQLVSFGATINIIRFSFPQLKFTINALSVGGYWLRNRVGFSSDSTRASVAVNGSYIHACTEVIFRPDSRWGATLGLNYIKPSLWNSSYELANQHPILQPYFDAFLKTNSTDKLFFRFRWSYEHSRRENNFTQIQLGYNVNLFGTKPTPGTN